jgi:hypothetical protein
MGFPSTELVFYSNPPPGFNLDGAHMRRESGVADLDPV